MIEQNWAEKENDGEIEYQIQPIEFESSDRRENASSSSGKPQIIFIEEEGAREQLEDFDNMDEFIRIQ